MQDSVSMIYLQSRTLSCVQMIIETFAIKTGAVFLQPRPHSYPLRSQKMGYASGWRTATIASQSWHLGPQTTIFFATVYMGGERNCNTSGDCRSEATPVAGSFAICRPRLATLLPEVLQFVGPALPPCPSHPLHIAKKRI